MISTRKFKIIEKVLHHIPLSTFLKVKTITKDLASNYDLLARVIFPGAVRIADKFHVLKLGFEAVQAVRVTLRQEILTAERKDKKNVKKGRSKKKKSKKKNEKKGKKITKKQRKIQKKFSNGDTEKELLARSRFLLFKREDQWVETQKERASILFQEYPEIQKSYLLMEEFRDFYAMRTGGVKEKNNAQNFLNQWYKKVKNSQLEEMENFSDTVKKHESEILAYFFTNATNSCAESLNAKIQRFLIASFGIKNRDFFHFRIKKYFAPD